MCTVFLRTATESGPRTIVFSASEADARLLADRLVLDFSTDVPPVMILPERPARASVAQIVSHRTQERDRELARIKRRKDKRANADMFNVTSLYARGEENGAGRTLRKG